MIRNQWYAILNSGEVPRGRAVCVTRMGEKLALWRSASGEVGCVHDRCAHRGASLGAGSVHDGHIACPFHGFEYDESGRCQHIPANSASQPVPERFQVGAYPVRDAHGVIWLWWGEVLGAYPPLPFFSDLDDSFSYGTNIRHWPVHYSRVVENQLDAMHLPFVHRSTIGRGGRTVVDGPVVKWVGDEMRVWVSNRVDDDGPALSARELPEPKGPARLLFRFPNVWQNRISDDVRVVALFVPVDDENSLLYLRFYQRVVRVPLLRDLICYAAMPFNRLVAEQDRRVVATQRPLATSLHMNENLVQGDRPIVEYRRRREHLKAAESAET